MNGTLRSSQNEAEVVRVLADYHCEEADQQLSLSRRLRRDADRDVFQALKAVQDLKGQLDVANSKFESLWSSMQYILSFIGQEEGDAMNLGEFILSIPSRFYAFLKDGFRNCVSNLLGHFRVLAPEANLEKIVMTTLVMNSLRKLLKQKQGCPI